MRTWLLWIRISAAPPSSWRLGLPALTGCNAKNVGSPAMNGVTPKWMVYLMENPKQIAGWWTGVPPFMIINAISFIIIWFASSHRLEMFKIIFFHLFFIWVFICNFIFFSFCFSIIFLFSFIFHLFFIFFHFFFVFCFSKLHFFSFQTSFFFHFKLLFFSF